MNTLTVSNASSLMLSGDDLLNLTDSNIPIVLKYYKDKKESYAQSLDNYRPQRKRGEKYGYTLAEPFTEFEVSMFELQNDVSLDPNFRIYLTKISKEVFIGSYPSIIQLPQKIGMCKIPEDKTFYSYSYLNDDEDDNEGVITIAENGCTSSDVIIVKGTHKGEVWRVVDDETKSKSENTFMEFLMKPFMKKEPLESLSSLESIANAYHILRIFSGMGGLKYKS